MKAKITVRFEVEYENMDDLLYKVAHIYTVGIPDKEVDICTDKDLIYQGKEE